MPWDKLNKFDIPAAVFSQELVFDFFVAVEGLELVPGL